METQELDTELPARQKLIVEAVLKMENGRKMFNDGKLELLNLTGHASPAKKAAKTKKIDGVPKLKKTIAHKKAQASGFKVDKRTDDRLKERMLKLVHKHGQLSSSDFKEKLKIGYRRVERLLSLLKKEGQLVDLQKSKEPGVHHIWSIPNSKPVNGHAIKAKSKTGGGTGSRKVMPGRGGAIDVTDETIVSKATSFLKTHDWVNKGMFLDAIGLSPRPGNRLIEYLEKQKVIKQVMKKNNPAHEKVKKIYVQEMPYFELA